MTKRRALAGKNSPRRLPLIFSAVVWLLMDRFDPPGYVWGIVGTIYVILVAIWLIDFFTAVDVELPKEPTK